MSKIYNENDYKNLVKDLKELPKINAPENFEYNLMTRIQNKNFGSVQDETPKFNWLKFLAPSAVVVTAIILFFIFLPQANQTNNPLLTQPKNIDSQSIVDNSAKVTEGLVKKNLQQKEFYAQPNQDKAGNTQSMISSNNSAAPRSGLMPLSSKKSVAVDDYISGQNSNQKDMLRGNIVNSGDQPSEFEGLLVPQKTDQKTVQKYRAQADSVKKAQAKADSLKKAQKRP